MTSSSEIDRQASEWVARLDKEDAPASVRAAFESWCAQNVRHQAAYLRQAEIWNRLDRLQALRPPQLERPGASDSTARRPSPRRTIGRWLAAAMIAAMLVSAVGYVTRQLTLDVVESGKYATSVGGFQRVVLSDGSTLELNTDSRVQVDIDRDRRVVRLERGEATFRVAHDPDRPFIVMVDQSVVRAVGTQFNVRRRSESVEVMVVEGVVALGSVDTLGDRRATPQPTTPVVSAGKVAIAESSGLKVHEVSHDEVRRALAWQNGMLWFDGQTLVECAAEFNRYNRRQLVVGDPALGSLRIGGRFRSTNVDTFAAVLQEKFGIQVTLEGEQILLH